ncbi:MAG TPA: large conductance mechanosensitive channel protein MscL [Pyrinomonadaceae bacterium]|nr:large conductance mechanosensitive channel protein MscL [Pyrinomonadaceae bacterium]
MAKDSGLIKEFREFIARGNVLDLAVAVVIGAAFTKIVTSVVEGVLMPPLGMITSKVDFSNLFYVLDKSKGIPATLADAKANGIPVLAYGQLVNDVLNFIIVAFVIFLIVKRANRLWSSEHPDAEVPTTKDCPFCLSAIPAKATRCKECTSEL